ncbi:MAG: ATP-binding cassette domain-containing protein [Lentisphaeria bacterium]|nr:ATP-binding cassette domain-containing protein [Lentisphaeria bacterium]
MRVELQSVPELLSVLVGAVDEQKEKRLQLNRENRELTSDALVRKLDGLGRLAGIRSTSQPHTEESDPLVSALREIAANYRLPMEKESELLQNKERSPQERLKEFVAAAGWRIRKIDLPLDYYKQSARPVLAFRNEDQSPVVLYLSANGSSYLDPARGNRKYPLDKKSASDFTGEAYCFYEPFPPGRKTKKLLLKFIFATAKPVLALIVIAGVISSLIGLVMPVATRYITGEIIPTANLPELWQLMFLLIVLTACEIGLGVVPALVMMLFSAQQYERFQAAVYDHILRVPVKTFRMCDSGDMTQRILGASQIQAAVFKIISQQFLGSLFSLVSLAMMFYYSPLLGAMGFVMVLIYAAAFFLLSRINFRPLTVQAAAAGRMSGLMKQFFDGMAKIRAAGAEQRILSRFTDDFAETVRQNYLISRNGAYQSMLSMIFPMLISVLFYALAGGFLDKNLPLPVFLAFMAAFQSFQGGVMGFAAGCWSFLAIKPELDRILPILEVEPEDDGERHNPGKLDGKVEVSHLNFRYSADSPPVLKDVSFYANPGEFIAIVGPSGAGKSSLVRLLLGFERPETGGIYYSGKDLANLELRSVRRQLGVILQSSKILPGTILENIITGTEYTTRDAWRALELAAFDQDVKDMPMGIHTLVTSETISGGQQQRILIARALVGLPAVVIMDEATSALDNLSQLTVKENMEKLHMTRIVIAHRLSTIIRADRIYVMEKGEVVQQGSYAELAAKEGLFKRLAERQLTERS